MEEVNTNEEIINKPKKEEKDLKKSLAYAFLGLLIFNMVILGITLFALASAQHNTFGNAEWTCVKYEPVENPDCLICNYSAETNQTVCRLDGTNNACEPKCEMEVMVRYANSGKIQIL